MNILQMMRLRANDSHNARLPVLRDSVMFGCFELYQGVDGQCRTVFDKAHSYITCLAAISQTLFPTVVPVMINAGISGDEAVMGLHRLEKDMLALHPDLTVVCFGLNDCDKGLGNLTSYGAALKKIFDDKERG